MDLKQTARKSIIRIKRFLFEKKLNDLKKREIIVYFFGGMGQTYQIKQWIKTFEELNKVYPIVVVVRNIFVEGYFRNTLPFPIKYCKSLNQLHKFYNEIDPKVIIYINNGYKNFQSLIYNDAMHIHINHGESDKASDHSNQVKAYDYVFVHAPNGFNNYMKYLIKVNPSKFIQTGRPQLDFIEPIKLETYGKKVILYAPTWEATHKSMRYTSVDIYGEKIVNTILKNDDYFLIYKPHPNLGANDKELKKIHNNLIKKIKKHKFAKVITNTDINNIYPLVDFAIFDMSSVMTDYLNVDKPFILADTFDKTLHKVEDYKILKACRLLTNDLIENLDNLIKEEINKDPLKNERKAVKELYLGNYKKGESIKKFIESIDKIAKKRDEEIKKKRGITK